MTYTYRLRDAILEGLGIEYVPSRRHRMREDVYRCADGSFLLKDLHDEWRGLPPHAIRLRDGDETAQASSAPREPTLASWTAPLLTRIYDLLEEIVKRGEPTCPNILLLTEEAKGRLVLWLRSSSIGRDRDDDFILPDGSKLGYNNYRWEEVRER